MKILEIQLVKKFVKKDYWFDLFDRWDNQKLQHKRLQIFFAVLFLIATQFIPIGGIPLFAYTMVVGILAVLCVMVIWGIWNAICANVK